MGEKQIDYKREINFSSLHVTAVAAADNIKYLNRLLPSMGPSFIHAVTDTELINIEWVIEKVAQDHNIQNK